MNLINPYFVGAGAVPGVEWNPLDSNISLIIDTGGLRIRNVSVASGYKAGRATKGIPHTSAGYLELYLETMPPGGFTTIGLATSSESLSGFVGSGSTGWGYYAATGEKVNSGVTSAYGTAFAQGDILGVAMNNGKVWFSKNGTWQNSGDPAAGTGEAFSGLAGTIYPMVALFDGINGEAVVGAFRSTGFVYSPPSGFPSWELA